MLRVDCRVELERQRGLAAGTSAARRGDLVVLPTDTVYGVGTDAFSARGVAALRAATGREAHVPLPVLVGHPRTVDGLVAGLPADGRALMEAFWPGPLTLLARQQPTLAWDIGSSSGGIASVAVRMPLHPVALDLLRATGPLAVTGANVAGEPTAVTCDAAEDQLGEAVTVYLDAGPVPGGAPSGVVDLTGPRPVLVRPGGFPVETLREVCPSLVLPGEAGPDA